ncbi:MAG: 30S ribosomal protein S16 [Thermoanaerobaculia bacterium]|nr:30S ribosomal protein S16 [Thermoanaerobaculia bacterium]
MVKIRLRRMGARNRPFYRVVVSDSRRTPRAPAIEELGYYDPCQSPAVVRIDADKVEGWVQRGAQVSPAVKKLLRAGQAPAAADEAAAS